MNMPVTSEQRPGSPFKKSIHCLRELLALVTLGLSFTVLVAAAPYPEGYYVYAGTFGKAGHETGQFFEPGAMAFSQDGLHLAVCDTMNNRVVVLNTPLAMSGGQASQTASFTVKIIFGDIWPFEGTLSPADHSDQHLEHVAMGADPPQREYKGRPYHGGQADIRPWDKVPMDRLYRPEGIAWKDPKTLIISDTGNHRLKVQRLDGAILGIIGQEGWKNGYFHHPMGLTIDEKNTLYVAEPRGNYLRGLGLDALQRQRVEGNRVQVFSAEGKYLKRWGNMHHMSGRLDRQYKNPTRVFVNSLGELLITDSGNHRVLWHSADGKPKKILREWPDHKLRYPQGIDGDGLGRMSVCDTGNHQVLILDEEGDLKQILGGFGIQEGRLVEPREARFGVDGNLYVLDSQNSRIEIFRWVGEQPVSPKSIPLPPPPPASAPVLPPSPPASEPRGTDSF